MSGKYWEKYQEKRLKLDRSCKTPTHTSDKQAYITSLEAQVEKSSSSTILIQTFSERIEQLQKQLNTTEERLANLTRLFKLQSSEPDNHSSGQINKLEERVLALEQIHKTKQESYKTFSSSVDSALKETEKRISRLIEEFEDKYKKGSGNFSFGGDFIDSLNKEREKTVKEAAEAALIAQQTCNKLAEDALIRISGCEKRIKEIKINFEDYEPDVEEIEEKVMKKLDFSIENLSNLLKSYVKSQETLATEFKEIKEKLFETKDPGVFSFGSTFPATSEIKQNKHDLVKSETNSREQSKEPDFKITRKRSNSPSARIKPEKKVKKEENKSKKKVDRRGRLEKLYQNFSEKNI
jgi:hypothetical protein